MGFAEKTLSDFCFLLFISIILSCSISVSATIAEANALLKWKYTFTNSSKLSSWVHDANTNTSFPAPVGMVFPATQEGVSKS